MKKYLGIILVGAMVAFGAGCSDDSSGGGAGSGGTAGSGGSGGSTGGTGGDPVSGIDLCATAGDGGEVTLNSTVLTDVYGTTDEINEDTFMSADCVYFIPSSLILYVTDSTLAIAAGASIRGDNQSALIITRGAEIDAQGTAENPIVMTSSRAEGARNAGDWGGLALLGEGVINRGVGTCGGDTGMVCVDNLEGLPATDDRSLFGGDDNASSCGTLTYVRIEFAGNEISPNNELNGLTVGGCGAGTTLDYIQVHRGLDDGVEFFGGASDISHVIVDGMGDDGIDWDQGYVGTIENFISHHYAGSSDDPRGIEADNAGSNTNLEPRSNPIVTYGTVVANVGSSHDQGIVLRRGTWGTLSGVVVGNYDTAAGIDIRDDGWDAAVGGWPSELSITDSCAWQNGVNSGNALITDFPAGVDCGEDTEDGDCNDESTENAGTFFAENTAIPAEGNTGNDTAVDPMLGDYEGAIDGETPDYSVGNDACAGAFAPDGTDWTEGWTAFPVD
jgi:hypothetical protein